MPSRAITPKQGTAKNPLTGNTDNNTARRRCAFVRCARGELRAGSETIHNRAKIYGTQNGGSFYYTARAFFAIFFLCCCFLCTAVSQVVLHRFLSCPALSFLRLSSL